jgi:predicted O-linked N-acetylglucosamine transferase (SPINDLY family)
MAQQVPSKETTASLRQMVGRATGLLQQGRLAEAEALYLQVLREQPHQLEARHMLGMLRIRQGRYDDACGELRAVLGARPDSAEAWSHLALALHAMKRHEEALAAFDKAIALRPDQSDAHNNRGNLLSDLGRHAEALASYERALALRPQNVQALGNRGAALADLNRCEEALASYAQALALAPEHPALLDQQGSALAKLGRLDEALASYVKALLAQPDYAPAHYHRGNVLARLKRYGQALASYDKALALQGDFADALDNRGNALAALKRHEEALASYDRALALAPRSVATLTNRGNARKALRRYEEALADYDAALALAPDAVETLYNRANLLKETKHYADALACYGKARALAPDHPDALGFIDAALHTCDFARSEGVVDAVAAELKRGRSPVTPFTMLGLCDDPALHLQCARNYIAASLAAAPEPLWKGEGRRHDRLRIAYLSADFQAHATAFLISQLIELHDRSRFEIHAISFGRDDGSAMRARLTKAFDRFHDVAQMSDEAAARLIREREIDIAVDLKGYTQDARPEILRHRGAPVQVSYLGFPGTMGGDFIDYVIADPIVLPLTQQAHYCERIVHLPDCYQPNDAKRAIAPSPARGGGKGGGRAESGLPEQGFVFCSFNNNYKIGRPIFDVWMRLLAEVPGSVLWLLRDNPWAEANLRREAQARGVAPQRLVFAERMPLDRHLARHALADLFLDTLPYNAHTTASDALWAGLPVLTCQGTAFAGRVAASLLRNVELPELICHSLEEYEAAALRLATDGLSLDIARTKLAQARHQAPLFDSQRHCRHIEAAYRRMWEIAQSGPPQGFAVERLPRADG